MPSGPDRDRRATVSRSGGTSDCALLQQTRYGQGEAFTLLYRRYAMRLSALVRSKTARTLSPRFDPEDVVQDAFSALFIDAVAGRYDAPEYQDVWGLLVVIALNRVRALANWHRAARRDVRRTLDGCLAEGLVRWVPAPEEWPLVELRLSTGETLKRLPPDQRRMVELRIEGDDVATIAAKVRKSTRTVERSLCGFRTRLRSTDEGG
jgi:DNA-directed RNA polymerase specialized sigma24 family protein